MVANGGSFDKLLNKLSLKIIERAFYHNDKIK
jgi:hypothetical protein